MVRRRLWLVCALLFLASSTFADPSGSDNKNDDRLRRTNDALMVDVFPTLVGAAEGYTDIVFEGQTAFSRQWALASIGEVGSISGIQVFNLQIGPQLRPFGAYLNGFLLGVYPGFGYLSLYPISIWFFSFTGETGYQWVFKSGFVLGLTTGFTYLNVSPYLSAFKWDLGANVGFAFADPFIAAK